MAPSVTSSVSRAGITTSETGERHIPSSVRPDGTVRKEIRVRPGYRPPEDVELYKNRTAQAWKSRAAAGVPGAESVATPAPAPAEAPSAAAAKNAKRREARKKAAQSTTAVAETEKEKNPPPESAQEEPVDPELERAKEAKKLAKKLRQARELQDKEEKGDSLLPEQFQKVIKINELIRQLENLGFDAEGEKRAHSAQEEE